MKIIKLHTSYVESTLSTSYVTMFGLVTPVAIQEILRSFSKI